MISKIAKYRIDRELGRGGFGRVYQGFDPDVQRAVAIKVLTAESDPELLKRFQVEIGTTGRLRHKNIVTLFECGEQSGVPFLVMELLEGQTLERIIKGGVSLTLLEKVRIMTQVAEGLAYAHSQGVIHRDVKPGNIMLLPDRAVKIMDFGIARVADRNTMVTREGYLVGTIPYMAPEQFEAGGKGDEQTDIFAYGDVYYELLTGRHPFSIDDVYGTIGRIKTVEPEPVSQLVPECPEALELLVHRTIAKDREIRYQTFSELMLDGEAILVDLQHERAAELLAEVKPLMAAGDMEAAESKLHQILELDPVNREARDLRNRIRTELRQRGVSKRVSALLEESEERLRRRQFAEAVQSLETALRLNRNDTAVQQRLTDANARLSGYMRANKLLAEARRDQQKGQLDTAIERLSAALEADPQHPDANTLISRLRTEQARRTHEIAVQNAMSTASGLLAQGNFDGALDALKSLEAERAAELKQRIEREREADRRKRAEQFRVAVARIREALYARELTKADHLLRWVVGQFTADPAAASVIAELQQELEAAYRADAIAAYVTQARELARQNSLRQALDLLNEGAQRFPDDTNLLRMRELAESRYAEQQRAEAVAGVIATARGLREAGRTREALEAVRQAIQSFGSDPALADLARQLEADLERQRYLRALEDLLRRSRKLQAEGDYDEAIGQLEHAREFGEEAEVRDLLAELREAAAQREEQRIAQAAIETAKGLERSGARDRALASLDGALNRFPQNVALREAADALRSRIAEEQRRGRIAAHRKRIEDAMSAADWKQAEQATERARRDFPGEVMFDGYAEEIRRALFELGLNEIAAKVQRSLEANDIAKASEELERGRELYSEDARWKRLGKEVHRRRVYNAALEQAEKERSAGAFDDAEARLAGAVREGAPDDRAERLRAAIRAQRLAIEQARVEQEHREGERREQERIAHERAEQEQREKAEQARREQERLAQERLAQERAEQERREQERREQERIAHERAEQEQREKAEQARREQERIARERAEQERREQERIARERAEQERREKEQREKEQREKEEQARREKEQRDKERAEQERRKQQQLAQAQRLAQERAERERLEKEQRDKADQERREQKRLAQERAEQERAEKEQREKERAEQERDEQQRREQLRLPFPTPPAQPAAKPATVRWTAIAAGVLLIATAGAVAWFKFHPSPGPTPPGPHTAQVHFVSDPKGASVTVNNQTCVAPCALDLPEGSYRWSARLDGYEPTQQDVTIGPHSAPAGDVRFSLKAVPPPPPPPPPELAGTVEVSTNQDDAAVLIDGQRYGLATTRTPLVASLKAGEHRVGIEKANYKSSPEQRVRVAAGNSKHLSFELTPIPARLAISNALAGAAVAIDGKTVGTVSADGSLTAEVAPGSHRVRLTHDNYAPREETVQFDPNQTVALGAGRVELTKNAPTDPAVIAAQEYAKVPNDADRLEEFAARYKGTPSAADALARSASLRWDRLDKTNLAALRDFQKKFPQNHAQETVNAIAGLEWTALDKNDLTKVQEFAAKYRDSDYASKAAKQISLLVRQKDAAADQAAKQQRAADLQAIQEALNRYAAAIDHKSSDELREAWPGVDVSSYKAEFKEKEIKTTTSLRPISDPRIDGNAATVVCERKVHTVFGSRKNDTDHQLTVTLHRAGAGWIIQEIR